MTNKVEIMGDKIRIAGKEKQILSGAMHYFRIHPDYWRDRLVKLRQCGLNTVETYVAWNLHEPREGEFDFTGGKDLTVFLKIAHEEGLLAIVRPGPYICSEWDLGGLPAWLLNKPGMRLRCFNQPYCDAAVRYMSHVLAILKPLQYSEGGPVIAMQIENEYGSYGNDRQYLNFLKKCFADAGITVPLFTSDGNSELHFDGGTLPGIFATANFRNKPAENLAFIDRYCPGTPKFVMELWNGGPHHWGKMFPYHDPEGVRQDVREVLANGFHLNLYMFHGGSNFGFMNGANLTEEYKPMLSTYDTDAPLSEEGDPTPKYFAIQEEIRKYYPEAKFGKPAILEKRAYGDIELTQSASLLESLGELSSPIISATPETMETYGQSYGFILYRTRMENPGSYNITLDGMKDRAVVMMNRVTAGMIYRNDASQSCWVTVPEGGGTLDILVENMGRVNFGSEMEKELKGLRGVRCNFQYIFGWEIYPLELNNLTGLKWRDRTPAMDNIPVFHRGTLEVDEPHDTFLAVPRGIKGNIFLNGFNLGRFWNIGPQYTLYAPAPLLKPGANEIIVLDLHGSPGSKVVSTEKRDFRPVFQMQLP